LPAACAARLMTALDPNHADALDLRRFRWTALIVGAATGVGLVLHLVLRDGSLTSLLVGALAVFLSKLFIFGGAIDVWPFNAKTIDLGAWELALIAWVIDLLVSCALLAGMASFERLRLAGRALSEARARASQTLREFPGLRRLAVAGITLLVFLPIPGSGAVTGTLVGRLVGLSRMATFAAVASGAGLAVSAYAGVASFLDENWRELIKSPTLVIASTLGLVGFVWFAWLRVRRELTRA